LLLLLVVLLLYGKRHLASKEVLHGLRGGRGRMERECKGDGGVEILGPLIRIA
jgi:hypothetical protein